MTRTPCCRAMVIASRIAAMPPILVTLGWKISSAPSSIARRAFGSIADVLASRDGNTVFAADASHRIVIVDRINWLLEPGEIVLLELARHRDGLVRRPGAVGIDHEGDIRSGSLSAGGHRLDQM